MKIDFRRRRLLVDDEPALVLAGEVHYFRLPRAEWGQRLDLLVEAGCDTVATYIPWVWHELPDGSIDLTGRSRPERDLGAFVDLVAERGLGFVARPGPFVMAELKNEGLPYRLYTEHPEIVPVGWDGTPCPTRTVDYLAPSFLAETIRWYDAVLPLLVERQPSRGGPLLGVQLDNEIGMLAWVANSPDLTDEMLADFRRWCVDRYGDGLAERYPSPDWATGVRSPREAWAAALRVDLSLFCRDRFARYADLLADAVRGHGITEVPLLINVHGTTGGNGIPYAIGLSQLVDTFRGRPGVIAGSDHYLGELTPTATADLHFLNAANAALNDADQPLTSLEFEAGTGDYGGAHTQLDDPSTVALKSRLFLAQGNRLINYYLLAGGINPPLEAAAGDGNGRISFTGERHGTAAPIGPEGQRALGFAPLAEFLPIVSTHSRWLADADEEHDDLAVGFWPDAFATEYRYPDSEVMADLVDDLDRYRGPGAGRNLWLPLLEAGFRFGAVDLQSSGSLPGTVAISTGRVLAADVQRRLVAHLGSGGSLLIMGRVPELDSAGRPCRLLADALGVTSRGSVDSSGERFCSVVGAGPLTGLPELRVARLDELATGSPDDPPGYEPLPYEPPPYEPLLHDVDGRLCGLLVEAAGGAAAVITAELPANAELITRVLDRLGCRPGLALSTSVPGVLALTGRTSRGERLLHLINPTGYDATVQLSPGDSTDLFDEPLTVPARSGHVLGLGLRLPTGQMLVAANAELREVTPDRLRFGPPLQEQTRVWLADADGERRLITGGDDLVVDL